MTHIKLSEKAQNELDDQMQNGYDLLMEGDGARACDLWWLLWGNIKATMKKFNYRFIEHFDRDFLGLQSIYNWSMDFSMELANAALNDQEYARKRIKFGIEYIERSKDKDESNLMTLKRDVAAAYFRIGEVEKGERSFRNYVENDPTSGWGWINWSDQYWLFALEQNKDAVKAINILKQGLKVDGLEDKLYVFERLHDIYTDLKMNKEAAEINRQIKTLETEQMKASGANRERLSRLLEAATKPELVRSQKIGRNDPCPCGSGKKYKKCCGKFV